MFLVLRLLRIICLFGKDRLLILLGKSSKENLSIKLNRLLQDLQQPLIRGQKV